MTEENAMKWIKLVSPAIKVLGWVGLLMVIVIRYGDRLSVAESSIKDMQTFSTKQQVVIQQMQLDQMRTSTILSTVENNLARDENKIDQLEQKH